MRLAQIGLRGCLRPQVLLGLIRHHLSIDDVANTCESCEDEKLLHGKSLIPRVDRWHGQSDHEAMM